MIIININLNGKYEGAFRLERNGNKFVWEYIPGSYLNEAKYAGFPTLYTSSEKTTIYQLDFCESHWDELCTS